MISSHESEFCLLPSGCLAHKSKAMSRKKRYENGNELASSRLTKEMQRLIAMAALDMIYGITTMMKTQVMDKMFELYHGSGSVHNMSLVEL
jgi:hypothetical protein